MSSAFICRGAAAVLTLACAGFAAIVARPLPQQPTPPSSPAAPRESANQEMNDRFVQQFSKQIAGHEQEPAGQVFKNIQLDLFKRTPAARLLLIMNLGYSRALGVNCTHCHVEQDFSSDERRPKRAAREMAAMHRTINDQLSKMENLAPNPQGHFINCSTCHRGNVNPLASEK